MGAAFEGGQGPEGAVLSWMDGWMDYLFLKPVVKLFLYISGQAPRGPGGSGSQNFWPVGIRRW